MSEFQGESGPRVPRGRYSDPCATASSAEDSEYRLHGIHRRCVGSAAPDFGPAATSALLGVTR